MDRRQTTALITASLASLALMIATPAVALAERVAAPYVCPASGICIYEGADGTGASFQVGLKWQGGFKLEPSGWDDRAASIANNSPRPALLYSTSSSGGSPCWVLRDTVAAGAHRPVAAGAVRNFDLVANDHFTECPR